MLVTLGVRNLSRSTAFFQCGGIAIALQPVDALAADAGVPPGAQEAEASR